MNRKIPPISLFCSQVKRKWRISECHHTISWVIFRWCENIRYRIFNLFDARNRKEFNAIQQQNNTVAKEKFIWHSKCLKMHSTFRQLKYKRIKMKIEWRSNSLTKTTNERRKMSCSSTLHFVERESARETEWNSFCIAIKTFFYKEQRSNVNTSIPSSSFGSLLISYFC